MIDDQLADRLRCTILGATQCKGFALVVFYEDDTEWSLTASDFSPRKAAAVLTDIADAFERQASQQIFPA